MKPIVKCVGIELDEEEAATLFNAERLLVKLHNTYDSKVKIPEQVEMPNYIKDAYDSLTTLSARLNVHTILGVEGTDFE